MMRTRLLLLLSSPWRRLLLPALLLLLVILDRVQTYKIGTVNSVRTSADQRFEPYERGFTGQYGDGLSPKRIRINEGGQARTFGLHGGFSPGVKFDQENQTLSFLPGHSRTNQVLRFELEGVAPRQECPAMVGPMPDGAYYCGSAERGYCDRRSGACHCYDGYNGIDCGRCDVTHISAGSGNNLVCAAKNLCPNDCAGGGECDFTTGICKCLPHRAGADCATPFCKTVSPYCMTCNAETRTCQACIKGYYVHDGTGHCMPCTDFDPRCAECSATSGCTMCADTLLNSVRRSGRRARDTAVPFDDGTRELSESFPFGSQSPRYFDEAEPFSTSTNDALSNKSVACIQDFDASWACVPALQSHVVCGHFGTLYFASPTFAVAESARYVLIEVKRTGGGMGTITVKYALKHITTSDADVGATAPYTSSQELTFPHGVVSLKFRVAVFDDYVLEADEEFELELFDARVLATGQPLQVAAQSITRVTVHDDDYWVASNVYTTVEDVVKGKLDAMLFHQMPSREPFLFSVKTRTPSALPRTDPLGIGQKLIAFTTNANAANAATSSIGKVNLGSRMGPAPCAYAGVNGTYNCAVVISSVDLSAMHVVIARPGGLHGDYYDNAFALGPATHFANQAPVISRFDPGVNFVWGKGPLVGLASDFCTVQWFGAVSIDEYVADPSLNTAVSVIFKVLANDHVRLFIDGHLLLDHWTDAVHSGDASTAVATLISNKLHAITLDYRELRGDAHVQLFWDIGDGNGFVIIPQEALYRLDPIRGSPFLGSVANSEISAPHSFASGKCLENAVAESTCSIRLHPRDAHGNIALELNGRPLELTTLLINAAHPSNTLVLSAVMSNSLSLSADASFYELTFIPEAAGQHLLSIQVDEDHIAGSPFLLNVAPGQAHAVASDAVGLGVFDAIQATRTAGVEYAINITVRDGHGNVVDTALPSSKPMIIVVHQTAPFETYAVTMKAVTGGVDGRFEAKYTVQRAGVVDVRLSINSDIFDESTMLEFTNAESHAGNTYASGNGIAAATSGVEAQFKVHVRDAFGNPVLDAGARGLVYSLEMGYTGTVDTVETFGAGSCTHSADDKMLCRYTPAKSSFFLNNPTSVSTSTTALLLVKDDTNGGETIFGGFGFQVTVSDGACDASQSVGFGDGTSDAVAGETTIIFVQAKDAAGNKRTAPCDSTVAIESSDGFVFADYQSDGIYRVEYVVTAAGSLSQDITMGGASLGNAPFAVTVWPAPVDPTMTEVTGDGLLEGIAGQVAEVFIQPKDAFGNNLTAVDSILEVELSMPEDEHLFISQRALSVDGASSIHDGSLDIQRSGVQRLVVRLAQPGGVDARFFKSVKLNKDEVGLQRVDNVITFDWTYPAAPPIASKAHGWGARWEGLVMTPDAVDVDAPLQYHVDVGTVDNMRLDLFFRVKTNGGGTRLWIDDVLAVNQWPVALKSISDAYSLVRTTPDTLLPLKLEFAKQPGLGDMASISVEWAAELHNKDPAARELRVLTWAPIPASALFRWREVHANNPVYHPADTWPAACEVIDGAAPLLEQTIVSAVETTFMVQMKDAFNNNQIHGNDTLTVIGFAEHHLAERETLGDPRIVGVAAVIKEDAGLWQVAFTPALTGNHLLFVSVNIPDVHSDLGQAELLQVLYDHSAALSPFQIDVLPGACSSAESHVRGTNMAAAVAGEASWFELLVLDAARNPRRVETDLEAVVFSKSGMPDIAKVPKIVFSQSYVPNGKFRIDFVAKESGTWEATMTLGGDCVVTTTIVVEPAQADAMTSDVVALMPTDGAVPAGSSLQVDVVARDRFGNRLLRGGDDFVLYLDVRDRFTPQLANFTEIGTDIVGDSLDQVYGFGLPWSDYVSSATDNGDGSYKFVVKVGANGFEPGSKMLLSVSLAHGAFTPQTPACAVVVGAQAICTDPALYGPGVTTGGLLAEHFLLAAETPFAVRIDSNTDTDSAAVLSSLNSNNNNRNRLPARTRWSGFFKAQYTAEYKFFNSHALLRVAGNELATGVAIKLRGGLLYSVQIHSLSSDVAAADAALNLTCQVAFGMDDQGATPSEPLPGTVTARLHSFTMTVSDDLEGLVERGDFVRVGGQTLEIEHYDGARQVLTTTTAFTGADAETPQTIMRRPRTARVPSHHLFYSAHPIKDQPMVITVV